MGVSGDCFYLRATHAHFFNDPSEYKYAIKLLGDSMAQYETQNKIKKSSISDCQKTLIPEQPCRNTGCFFYRQELISQIIFK